MSSNQTFTQIPQNKSKSFISIKHRIAQVSRVPRLEDAQEVEILIEIDSSHIDFYGE
jgi:hypothetical protein